MGCWIGIDVGAVAVKVAVLADGAAGDRLKSDAPPGVVSPVSLPDGPAGLSLWVAPARRTRGRPIDVARRMLDDVVDRVGRDAIAAMTVAGSGGPAVAETLGVRQVNEFKALAAAAAMVIPGVPTLFEMGGETSKFLLLDDAGGIVDYQTNGDCAAGTGSFLDQQAGRLHYEVDQIGRIVADAARSAQIAGRCSVFAKSDMIHAQQKGYTPPEVLRGLCDAVARNYRSTVFRSRKLTRPAAFIGGVASNSAVVRAMREAFDLGEGELIVPPAHEHFVAIGAAAIARTQTGDVDMTRLARLATGGETAHFPTTEPLSTHRILLLRDQVEPYTFDLTGRPIDAWLGIDVGSVSTNLVVVDDAGRVVYEIYTRTRGRPIAVVTEGLEEIRDAVGDRVVVRGVGTTGSGRELIGALVGADTVKDEITCHKTGASFIGRKMIDRVPDTIFEIGGQDSKFISLQDGIVVDFTMNDACAAGTGSFLEERAEELGVSIKDEFAHLALASAAPIRLGERCTVFMEHDVNNVMQRGADKGDVIAGLAYSIATNYINRVVRGRAIGDQIFFQGGTAYNDAVAAAFASILDTDIVVPPHNGVMGAIGAALLAREKMALPVAAKPRRVGGGAYASTRPGRRETTFRGWEMDKVDYTLREFTCNGCSNHCAIQEFTVEGEKTYWGDKCSERFRKQAKTDRTPVIEDLGTFRERLLLDETDLPSVPADAPLLGVPRCLYTLELLPFYRTLLAHCGLRTVLSDPTNRTTVTAGLDAVVAEPCFPITVAHGHIAELAARGTDYLFLPNVFDVETPWTERNSYVCPWGQTLPYVARRSPAFAPIRPEWWLSPVLRFREGPRAIRKELRRCFKPLGIPARRIDRAVTAALAAQRRFRAACYARGAEALEALHKRNERGIVLVGRPYNIHDAGVSLAVQQKLRESYGVNVIPIDCLDTDAIDVREINDNMYWHYGRKILAVAKLVADYANLDIIYVTNFKCGPDSFVKHFIRSTSGRPFLTLQFDGHSNDAGMMTRCEAYLDSKGFLRPIMTETQKQLV
ncbi:MAG: acyl-CoA dehydratase activase [Planctomycetota bacterium]